MCVCEAVRVCVCACLRNCVCACLCDCVCGNLVLIGLFVVMFHACASGCV